MARPSYGEPEDADKRFTTGTRLLFERYVTKVDNIKEGTAESASLIFERTLTIFDGEKRVVGRVPNSPETHEKPDKRALTAEGSEHAAP